MQMSMKYPIDIRKAIYASVVPVRCDNERGTAFFIAPDTLVTARHIVAQYAIIVSLSLSLLINKCFVMWSILRKKVSMWMLCC